MPETDTDTTPIPEIFDSRKCKILADLSVPDAEYTDLSPKGSVDEDIRDLIRDINALPGLVTTSSCAGRISVFLEGRGKKQQQQQQQKRPYEDGEEKEQQQQRQFVPSGGKGAGRWLYVSHEPLERPESEKRAKSLHELFGLIPSAGAGKPSRLDRNGHAPRLVRFHFEPMVCTVFCSMQLFVFLGFLGFLRNYIILSMSTPYGIIVSSPESPSTYHGYPVPLTQAFKNQSHLFLSFSIMLNFCFDCPVKTTKTKK